MTSDAGSAIAGGGLLAFLNRCFVNLGGALLIELLGVAIILELRCGLTKRLFGWPHHALPL